MGMPAAGACLLLLLHVAARVADALWWRPRRETVFGRFTAEDLVRLRERFRAAGNLARLDG